MTKAVKDKTQDQRIADLEAKVSALIAAAATADPTTGAGLVSEFATEAEIARIEQKGFGIAPAEEPAA